MSTSSEARQYNPLIVFAYTSVVALWIVSQKILIPYEVHFFILVIGILYIACHRSLILLVEEEVSIENEDGTTTTEKKALIERETMRKEDAMFFPVMASGSIFTLYMAFKFFDRDVVNMIISGYMFLMGGVALSTTVSPLLSMLLPILEKKRLTKEISFTPYGDEPWDFSFDLSLSDIFSFFPCVALAAYQYKRKYWALNNVFGIVFCLQGVERFSLGTYKIGSILLIGLFFYDIFWVFGTDVMVTVAKGVDGPIKILFPKTLNPDPETGKLATSLLGLGDIVIPGFFLALLLRFDAHRCESLKKASKDIIHAAFPKPYFHSCLFAYVLGLVATNAVMFYFEAAQPALLYLVPACLLGSLLTAVVRGELKELLAYSEEEEEEEKETEKKEEEKKKD